jgi:hypothetical protein
MSVTINNTLTSSDAKLKIKFYYTTTIDDINTVVFNGSKYILLNTKTLNLKHGLNANIKMYKIYIYIVFDRKVYRYDFYEFKDDLNFVIDVSMGKFRPIVRINNKSAKDFESINMTCCIPTDNEDRHLDAIVYNRDHPEPEGFCIIS